jgi:arylsulfatase A-like enzyme
VSEDKADEARKWIAGYYAHCTALDDCMADLLQTLDDKGIADTTIVLFFSDHGDMLGSQNSAKKQQPWEESIRIPFLMRWPEKFGVEGKTLDARIDIPDMMPTLLGLCDIDVPDTVQGLDFSDYFNGGDDPSDGAAFLQCALPFGQWVRTIGGREYRGLRTDRYTYVRSLDGPWLLYDNEVDPYQLHNLIDDPAYAGLRADLDVWLQRRLDAMGDEFKHGLEYIADWGYTVDERETVPYTN